MKIEKGTYWISFTGVAIEVALIFYNVEYLASLLSLIGFQYLFVILFNQDELPKSIIKWFESLCAVSLIVSLYSVIFESYSVNNVVNFIVVIDWLFYMVCFAKYKMKKNNTKSINKN